MKKVFKLISLFILLLIVNVGVVNAAVAVQNYSGGFERLTGRFGGKIIDRYQATLNNKIVDIYCHNPGVSPYQESDFVNNKALELKTLRTLSNPSENNRLQNIYDKGLMYIISNKCGKSTVSDKCYVRNYIAVNLYEQLFPTINSNGSNTNAQINYLKWILKSNFTKQIELSNSKKATIEEEVKTLNRLVGSKFGLITSAPNISKSSSCAGNNNCDTFGQTNEAVKLVANALNEAIEYAKEPQENMPTISMSKGAQTKTSKGSNYTDTIAHTIKIAKFGTKEVEGIKPSAALSFECKNDACKKATITFTLNGGSLKSAKSFTFDKLNDLQKINLVDYTDKNGTGTFELKIKFTGKNCDDPIDYAVNLTYTQYILTFSSGYSVSKCTNSNKCQGFYVNDTSSASGTRTSTLENSINLCNTSESSSCIAKIDNVDCIECQENRHTIKINEGYDYSDSNVCNTSDNDLNISKCIANDGAKDASGHSYKNTELSAKTSKAGVGVYCMENYTLNLPGSIVTEPFRSFILNPSIEGTQTCLTNKIDGLEKVEADMISKSKESVKNYNEYLRLKAEYDCLTNPDSKCNKDGVEVKTTITKDPTNCRPKPVGEIEDSSECYSIDGKVNNKDGWQSCHSYGGSLYMFVHSICHWKVEAKLIFHYDYPGGLSCGNDKPIFKEGTWESDTFELAYSESNDDDVENPDIDNFPGVAEKIEELKSLIGSEAEMSSETIIAPKGQDGKSFTFKAGSGILGELSLGPGDISTDAYNWNNATGYYGGDINPTDDSADKKPFTEGWKMNYNFGPTMKFWYQESNMQKARTNEMDRNISIGELSTAFCMGEIDPKTYECKTGWKDAPETKPLSLCVCDENGCSTKTYELSKVKYSKQTQTATASFITPTQFYTLSTSGRVVVGEPGQSSKIQDSIEETNKLVIDPETIGTRRYTLWIENLGDYFNNDKLGRIWGESNSVVPQLLSNRETCDKNNENAALVVKDKMSGASNGAYVCKYTTDCPNSNICKTPDESPDNEYHCQDGEICDEEEYNEECNNTCTNPKVENGQYSYCDYLPLGSDGATYQCRENVSEAQHNTDCCPNGECPVSIGYTCAVTTNEKNPKELIYYGKNGQVTDEKTYKAQCCPDGNCPVTCTYCLYDGKKLNVQYRPITSEDINPNDRELGVNWKADNPIETTLELKAYVTTKEIEEDGDKIFDLSDTDFNNKTDTNDTFAMQVKMTPSMTSAIRSMNTSSKYNKGFVANTLKCYDYDDGDKLYENIYCYSTFLDDLIEKFGTGKDKPINFTVNRPLSESDRKSTTKNEQYFTSLIKADLLSQESKNHWNITTTTALETNKFGIEIDDKGNAIDYHVGPSWK